MHRIHNSKYYIILIQIDIMACRLCTHYIIDDLVPYYAPLATGDVVKFFIKYTKLLSYMLLTINIRLRSIMKVTARLKFRMLITLKYTYTLFMLVYKRCEQKQL